MHKKKREENSKIHFSVLAPMRPCANNGCDLQSHQYLNWDQHFSRYRNINPLFSEHLTQCIIQSYIESYWLHGVNTTKHYYYCSANLGDASKAVKATGGSVTTICHLRKFCRVPEASPIIISQVTSTIISPGNVWMCRILWRQLIIPGLVWQN